jgi:hypothetical protein
MSLIGQLLKGLAGGAGWTAGKKIADDVIDNIRQKIKERKEENDDDDDDALSKIEVKSEEDK